MIDAERREREGLRTCRTIRVRPIGRAAMVLGKKPPELAREPASPISYGHWTRRADRRNGRRDGVRRIPSLAEVSALVNLSGPTQLPTPYLEMLLNRARDMMEHERLLFLA